MNNILIDYHLSLGNTTRHVRDIKDDNASYVRGLSYLTETYSYNGLINYLQEGGIVSDIRFNGYEFYGIFFYFIRNITNYACLIGLFITISFIIMGLFILSHLPLVLVYFDDISIWQQFKLAFIMAFRKIGKTILICLIIIAFTFLCLLQGLEIIIFIFGISLPLFLIVKITFKEYIKIYRKVENKENEKNDKII
jgi:hypothetical protein